MDLVRRRLHFASRSDDNVRSASLGKERSTPLIHECEPSVPETPGANPDP
jgi:hypothetical protein